MFAYRHMRLLLAAALCAGSVQALAADGAGNPSGKSFGRLELSGQWLSPQRFGPSSAFFSVPLGEEVVRPPVRSGAETVWPEPATAPPVDARAAVTSNVEAAEPPKTRANAAAKRPAPPRAAAKRAPSNPMNSYARDTREPRRQAWPCTGGGICAWR